MNLQIDSKQKTASLELELAGENEPVSVNIGKYQIIEENGKTFIELSDVKASKEWLNILAELPDVRRFEITGKMRLVLKALKIVL